MGYELEEIRPLTRVRTAAIEAATANMTADELRALWNAASAVRDACERRLRAAPTDTSRGQEV